MTAELIVSPTTIVANGVAVTTAAPLPVTLVGGVAPTTLPLGIPITGGATNQLLYQTSGSVLGEITKANSSVLVTNGSGVPAWGTTLPAVTLTTPILGVATGTSLALGGATLGGNALAVTGTTALGGALTPTGGVAPVAGSFSPRIYAGAGPSNLTAGGSITPSTTTTYIIEITIPGNMTITGVAYRIGSGTPVGNVTVGLATSAGVPIAAAKSASTPMGAANATQLVPFASQYSAIGPTTLHVQIQYDTATAATAFVFSTGIVGTTSQTGQSYGTFTSFTPPTGFVTNVGVMCALY